MTTRRYDLDWLRICAFALLIFYHLGMFYATWDWHVKSSRASHMIEPAMLLVNPWRLTLLFIISGAATRFMADKTPSSALLRARMGRLIPPLLLAIFVVVPPQSYLEVLEALGDHATDVPWSFWIKYVTASGHWCDAGGCLITPTYNHMWFVAYLATYTLILIAILPALRRIPQWLGALIVGPGIFITPWAFLAIARIILLPRFGATNFFYNDWYQHLVFLAAFLFGFGVAKREEFFGEASRVRWLAVALALTAYCTLVALQFLHQQKASGWGIWIAPSLHELQAWCAIVAAFGFAYRYLRNADGPLRCYLTEAIFPFYLIHQTAIVVAGHYLNLLRLPVPIEATVIFLLTALSCVVFLEMGRRVAPLRPWLGLSYEAKRVSKA